MKRALVGLAGAAMVVAMVVRYPPDGSLDFDPGLFTWPQTDKLVAVFWSCAGLLAIDLAAYAAGRALHGFLRRAPPLVAGLATVERMALGFLLLADAALLLAALHALQRPLIAALVLASAAAGAWLVVRDLKGVSWRPERSALLIAAAAGLLLLSPLLAAWLPDYGWDGFAYHLAIPERYLFRNRIVVTPLFPHSAISHTVEMLYLLALSLDSGALAKLLNLQFGALAAVAVYLMARRSSRRAGLLAVAILAADPLFNWELGVAYTDLAAALFALLAAAGFDEWRRDGSGAALRLAAVFAGASVSVRYTAAAIPLALATLIWLQFPWRGWRTRLSASLSFASVAGLVFAPWLLRNLAFTGNPFGPVLQSLFHAKGHEYFNPLALAQMLAFTRGIGFGQGLLDLLLLPVNATLRVRIGFYDAFGYRMGVLYVIGGLALLATWRRRNGDGLSTLPALVAILTLLWFFTFQEPRYLVPALCLLAVLGGVGLDRLLPTRLSRASLLWAIPVVALLHTQATAALLLPYRYGYALGARSVQAFEAQEPALAVVPELRRVMQPGDRLMLLYENRGFFYRDLDYVFANTFEVMQMLHEAASSEAFASRLRELGVTLVLVNPNNIARYRTTYVEGYGRQDFEQDVAKLEAFVKQDTTPLLEDRGVLVRRLRSPPSR